MTTTLITDAFDEGEPVEPVEIHRIVYGSSGWTDQIDDATIRLLVDKGIIVFKSSPSGKGWKTAIYVSVDGGL